MRIHTWCLQKTCTDGWCQTDSNGAAVLKMGSSIVGAMTAAKTKAGKALKLAAAVPWPLTNTWKTIQSIYADKVKADAIDDAASNPRQSMLEYVDDWFKNQYVKA